MEKLLSIKEIKTIIEHERTNGSTKLLDTILNINELNIKYEIYKSINTFGWVIKESNTNNIISI